MPYALSYIPPTDLNSDQGREILQREEMERRARKKSISIQWDAYRGNYSDVFKDSSKNPTLKFNPIQYAVKSDAQRMLGLSDEGNPDGIEFVVIDNSKYSPVIPNGSQEEPSPIVSKSPEQEYLNSVWKLTNLNSFFLQAFIISNVTGHVFVKLVPNGRKDQETGNLYVRPVLLDPKNVSVFWDSMDYEQVLWYRIRVGEFPQDSMQFVEDHIFDRVSNTWKVLQFEIPSNGQPKQLDFFYESAHPLIIDWKNLPYPFDYYGEPDYNESVIGLNRAAIFLASNIQSIIRSHAHPKTVGIGFSADQLMSTSVDSFLAIPSPDAKVLNLEMRSDLSSSREFLDKILSEIYTEMREVNPLFEGKDLDQVTNYAVRILFFASMQKTAAKRASIELPLSYLNSCILFHGGLSYMPVRVNFPESMPKDPTAHAQTLAMDVAMGLSHETYLRLRGYNPVYEATQKRKEQQDALKLELEKMKQENPIPNQDNQTKKN